MAHRPRARLSRKWRAGRRTAGPGGVCQPRRRPGCVARDACVCGASPTVAASRCTPPRTTWCSSAAILTASGKPYGVFTPCQDGSLAKLTPYHLAAYPVERHAAVWPRSRRRCPALCRRCRIWASRPTCIALAWLAAARGQASWPTTSRPASSTTPRRATSRRLAGPSYCRWRCASGRCRSAAWRAPRTTACTRARAAPRPGSPSWSGATSTTRSCTTTRSGRTGPTGPRRRAVLGASAATPTRRSRPGPRAAPAIPAGGRGDGPDQPDRLHAQPAAHGHGELPRQGPGISWRRGEAYLRCTSTTSTSRPTNGGWQGGPPASRRAAVVPHLQPGDAEPEVRFRWTPIRRYLPQLAALPDAAIHAPRLADPAVLAAAGSGSARTTRGLIVDHRGGTHAGEATRVAQRAVEYGYAGCRRGVTAADQRAVFLE